MQKVFWGFITGISLVIFTAFIFKSIPRPKPQTVSASTVSTTPSPSITNDVNNYSTIDIYAAGQPALGVYPTMVLVIHGTVVRTYQDVEGNYSKRKFEKFSYTGFSKINPSDVQVQFVNDYYDPKTNEDRNLYVDKIVVDGKTYETESDATFSTGSWSPTNSCAQGYKKTEELACNGYFQYDSPQQ